MTPEKLQRWVEGGFEVIREMVNEGGMGMPPHYFFYALRDPDTGEPLKEPTTCGCSNGNASREVMVRSLARVMDLSDAQATIMVWIDRDIGHVNLLARSLSGPELLVYMAEVAELDGITVCGPFRAARMHIYRNAPGLA